MRPMCETRKRRHSDPQLLANKRLTNGKTVDHVTTRSQAKAKNDPSSRVSPTRNVKHKVLTTEERRLLISMRLRHEERNTTHASNTNSHQYQGQEEGSRKHLKSSNRLLNGGRANGLTSTPVKSSFRAKLRTKVLSSINEDQNEIVAKSVEDALAVKRATEAENRETRAKKRRSALWVLNCEAEEFLFGETAAAGHEVELPPMSSPPRKRRRMRATELGDLLKETPLLESKLRHPTGCSESETSSATSSASNKKRKDKKSRGTRTQNSSRVKRKLEVESSGISSEPGDVFEDENGSNLEFPNLSYALMLEVASSSMTRIRDSSSQEQSVRIQRILNSLEFTFSFENVPSSEVWYRTFCHQDRPRHTFHATSPSSVILPYEAKGLSRESKKRLRRAPRKSPRCHASTQAILSLLKPTRSGRSSGAARPISPTSPSQLPPPPSSSKSKSINNASHIQETPVSSTSCSSTSTRLTSLGSHSFLLQTSTAITTTTVTPTAVSPPLIPPNGIENGIKTCEMTATQYLWDSIQFLTDPYVIHVLSLSESRSGGGSGGAGHSRKGPRTPRLSKVSQINSLLESPVPVVEKKPCPNHIVNVVNHNNNLKSPLKLVIPSPKTSPRFLSSVSVISPATVHHPQQNGNCSKTELRRNRLRSPPVSPQSASLSPTSATLRKTRLRKSPEVVSPPAAVPESTVHLKHAHLGSKFKPSATSKHSPPFPLFPFPSPAVPDEVLFSMESLPDFPWESFYQ